MTGAMIFPPAWIRFGGVPTKQPIGRRTLTMSFLTKDH
jgi:hypothetical protein